LFIILCPVLIISQNVEVEGGLIADSIDVQSGLIKNVADPISAQDAATKAYVDNILLSFAIGLGPTGVQGLLNIGYTPLAILNGGASITDFYGLNYGGGIIFYLLPDGTGLVAAPEDQSVGAEWGCIGTDIPGLPNVTNFPPSGPGAEVGDGVTNTAVILNECTSSGIAAAICASYDDGTWFLPSAGELHLMYTNLYQAGLGGFAAVWYWSSTEFGVDDAWLQYFGNGDQGNRYKIYGNNVRAVRAF
ncbi:MAG: hypothetical protein ACJA1A_002878, partial [Saprospiraceae bacterium]